MMSEFYEVKTTTAFDDLLLTLPDVWQERITHKLEKVATNPLQRNHSIKKIDEPDHYRLMVGHHYQVYYQLENVEKIMIVTELRTKSSNIIRDILSDSKRSKS